MADTIRLPLRLALARVQSDWQYRTSFALFLVAQAIIAGLDLIALVFIVRLVPALGGWTDAEVIFLYGLTATPFALADGFISSVEDVSDHIRTGTFDRFLLRPAPALVQLCATEFEFRRLGKLVPATSALAWSITQIDVEWGLSSVALLPLALACGTLIYSGLWIGTASIAFWAIASREVGNTFTYGSQHAAQYPLQVYPRWLRGTLGWAIPVGFVGYVPALTITDAANPLGLPNWFWWTPLPVAMATFTIGLAIWATGIRHYQSTGS